MKITPKGRKQREKQINMQKKGFKVGIMINFYIEDLVKLYAEEKQTENAGNVEKSWRTCRKVMETSFWVKEMWQEEIK